MGTQPKSEDSVTCPGIGPRCQFMVVLRASRDRMIRLRMRPGRDALDVTLKYGVYSYLVVVIGNRLPSWGRGDRLTDNMSVY